jgi:glutamine synthetase
MNLCQSHGECAYRRLARRRKGTTVIEDTPKAAQPAELTDTSVTSVRVVYPDLHGYPRGTDVPIGEFDHVAEHGLAFCAAIMGTDLRHTPVVGPDQGYPDLIAVPDLTSLTQLPWEQGVAWCIADVQPVTKDAPRPADPRGALRRAIAGFDELDLAPIVGPELEFFLCVRDPESPNGVRRYVDNLSMVYTVGPQADPRGVVREIAEALSRLGMGTFAATHEFMNSQYEINLRHDPAMIATDRAFRLKAAVKDVAAQHGLVATFMGKPFNDQGGSGFHVHVSADRDDDNAFADDDGDGVSAELRRFTAGVLAHAPALMAFLNPTVNAYRRLVPDSLAPTCRNWGWDNRTTFIRIPPERGRATRVEVRVGDASANPYLATAALLFAGLHGLREDVPLPDPIAGNAYALGDATGEPLPVSLDEALHALEADRLLRDAMSPELVDTFVALKRFEIERHRMWVSDWDIAEYLHHL